MKQLLLTFFLAATAQLAHAHEGHAVDMASLAHYFSAPHLPFTAMVVLVASIGLVMLIRRHRQGSR